MAHVKDTKLHISRHDSSKWDVRVTGHIDFAPEDTGQYKLSIQLFGSDKGESESGTADSLLYTFFFSQKKVGSIHLAPRAYKVIPAQPGESVEFDETHRIDKSTLDEDPGYVWIYRFGTRIPIPRADEIYAVARLYKDPSVARSNIEKALVF